MNGLNSAQIQELLGKTKTRNQYGPKLVEFDNSDEAGIDVAEVWPVEFGSKVPTTLYQGFINAAKKANVYFSADNPTGNIMVKLNDDKVFLLNRDRLEILKADDDS